MSQSGQQHPKADVGGQRSEPKKSNESTANDKPTVRETVDAGKKGVATSDAKK